jgi:hypothetical protein
MSDFLNFGSPLEGYSDRYVKFSNKKKEHVFHAVKKYIGEWSKETKKPSGRGICIYPNGNIHIGYYNNGELAPGNDIYIFSDGGFIVGEVYLKDG